MGRSEAFPFSPGTPVANAEGEWPRPSPEPPPQLAYRAARRARTSAAASLREPDASNLLLRFWTSASCAAPFAAGSFGLVYLVAAPVPLRASRY